MLSDLRLRQFRCFETLTLELGPGFNFFLGANGQGKTTILEAACVILRLQSQRSSSLAPLGQAGRKGFALRAGFDGHELEFQYGGLRRRISFDGVEQRTATEYLRLGRVVSFANVDIELARGGSEFRRRYLDFIGAQLDATYRPTLRGYERALRARNWLLKSPTPRGRELAAYDRLLVEHGTRLQALRAALVVKIAPSATAAYRKISGGREEFSVGFVSGTGENFADELKKSQGEETRLRQTIVGPHRDELEMKINGMNAATFASEGQQRSAVLALKLAQAALFASAGGAPVLLLDDIFGELDSTRRNALLDHLPCASQKLVTATAMPWRAEFPAGHRYELEDGKLHRVV